MTMTTLYISRLVKLAEKAAEANASAFEAASSALAATLTGEGLIHLFGSGHSVLPTQETYPRYGSYVGFNPLTDPRVMWHNILGAGRRARAAVAGEDRGLCREIPRSPAAQSRRQHRHLRP